MNRKTHNFKVAMMNALKTNDRKAVCEIAQEVFEAGHELEDLELTPHVFNHVGGILVTERWTPTLTDKMREDHES